MQVNTQLIRPAQVCQILAISSTTLWRLSQAGKLKPIKISLRATAYRLEDIENYITKMMEVGND